MGGSKGRGQQDRRKLIAYDTNERGMKLLKNPGVSEEFMEACYPINGQLPNALRERKQAIVLYLMGISFEIKIDSK